MLQRTLDGTLDILPHGPQPDRVGIISQDSRLFLKSLPGKYRYAD